MADMREKLIDKLHDWAIANNDSIRAESVADYLIENSKILSLCKIENSLIKLIGSTVYSYNDDFGVILPYFVENLNIGYYDEHKNCYTYEANCTNEEENELIDSIDFGLDDIGKTVFLTKEEAQKVIEGRSKQDD